METQVILCASPQGRAAKKAGFLTTSQQEQYKYAGLRHSTVPLAPPALNVVYFKLHPYVQGKDVGGNIGKGDGSNILAVEMLGTPGMIIHTCKY